MPRVAGLPIDPSRYSERTFSALTHSMATSTLIADAPLSTVLRFRQKSHRTTRLRASTLEVVVVACWCLLCWRRRLPLVPMREADGSHAATLGEQRLALGSTPPMHLPWTPPRVGGRSSLSICRGARWQLSRDVEMQCCDKRVGTLAHLDHPEAMLIDRTCEVLPAAEGRLQGRKAAAGRHILKHLRIRQVQLVSVLC